MSKKFEKTTGFFIKSFLLMLFLALTTIVLSNAFIEPSAYNFMVQNVVAGTKNSSDNTVIVAIDDKSLSYHRWPWPREYYGKIIAYFRDYSNPKIIGFDSLIQNLDKEHPESDLYFFNEVNKTNNLVVGFSPLDLETFSKERNDLYNKKFNDKFKINVEIQDGYTLPTGRYNKISEFPDIYFDAVKYVGSVNHVVNSNGYLTTMPQLLGVYDNYYPSLALRMYLVMNSKNSVFIGKDYITAEGTSLAIPTEFDSNSGFLSHIRFYKLKENSEYTHKKYSASDIIKSYEQLQKGETPLIDPKEFDGKVVFIGANAKASGTGLEDTAQTPLLKYHPGVDIQATNFDNILQNDFIKLSSFKQDILTLIAISVLTFILICNFSFITSLMLTIALAIGYFILAIVCFYHTYSVLIATPILLQAVTSIFGYSFRFIKEGRDKEKIKQAMGKYLSQDIMKNVVKNIDDIKLGGKRANVTVLFADIRGFTSLSEKMTAEEVSKILNEYFTEIEPIISSYNGVINKFIGDAVMAIFGEPIQDLNHPINAVRCAYAMLKKVEELQDKWLFEGKPKIEIGIGINTGEAFVGNIGSEKRLEYTVIGDTVNLASRIESYNKVYHTNLLVSYSTYTYISDIANVIKISDVSIRGKSRKMDIYEILKLNDN